ncbi:AAA family ATPase [Aquiflexum sp. TKW24L]|uniref:adenylate/guanylate cyclase domain-containing protein n=1 Tax=Aquiflexum sp. TKW24L TaxID=2942212 RepID=UPI0020BE5C52|nr:adenylate/guanylate cyclase domain-containing protein [Aquiflexum sp. TKW24L]MCL6259022.1 AAA family ATPase [Aquiflexum sp. TKW24L]
MELHVLYAGKIHSILKSESFFEQNFVIKRASLSTLSQIDHLKAENEASFAEESVEGFRKVLASENTSSELNLKLQFIKGQSLKEYNSGQLPVVDKLKICIAIAKRLAEVHSQEIVHLNLNPHHILVESGTNKIYFISLGLATRIQRKIGVQSRLIFAEADYDFIAPEQTGRISTDIGYYTDIYSLGVVFYWLFTEKLPFESKEGLSKIHAHIALTPISPAEINAIPTIISDLILKMLEKDVQLRYHSAKGVSYDLELILNSLQRKGKATTFELGTNDSSGILRFSDELYGRENQVRQLNETFQRVMEDEKILMLVYGNSGVGKSVLVEQLYRPVIKEGGFFLSGKFDQLRTDVPYFAFSQALGRLVNQILLLNEKDLAHWKHELSRLLHPIGRVLFDIIPGLEKLLESEPELPVLNGVEAQLRFNYAMSNLFQAFSDSGKPLVIFIDDLQWSDLSSLNLMRNILSNKDLTNILIIGAYRDNEITTGHLFLQFKMEIEKLGILPEEIHLDNLQYEDIQRLVTNTLGKSKSALDELVKIVDKKSGGNALFVNQFLKAIYKNEMLHYDSVESAWKWDTEKLMGYNVEGDIVNLFLETIKKLPSECITVLKLASCMGNKFGLGELAIITKGGKNKVYQDLKPALDLDLIIESRDGYLYFVHDRVQQAFYSLNDELGKREYHLKIGRLLLESTDEEDLRESIFDIVNQFNFAKELISDPLESKRLCELNVIAGQRSQSATAYSLALQYYENAIALTGSKEWNSDPDFSFSVFFKGAEAAYQSNNQERFGQLTQILDKNVVDKVNKLKLAILKIKNANIKNDQQLVIDIGLKALKEIDYNPKKNPSKIDFLAGFFFTSYMLRKFSLDDIAKLPKNTDQSIILSMEILSYLAFASYFLAPMSVPLYIFKMFRMTLKHGLSPNSPFVIVVFGYINIVFMNKIDKGLDLAQLGYKLSEILTDEENGTKVRANFHIFISFWLMPMSKTLPDLEDSFKRGLQTGEFEFNSLNALMIMFNQFFSGEPVENMIKRGELLTKQMTPLNQSLQIERVKMFRQVAISLVDGVSDYSKIKGEILDEDKLDFPDGPVSSSYYGNLYELKKVVAIIFNKNELAYQNSVKQKPYLVSVIGTMGEYLYYFYENICISLIYHSRNGEEQKKLLKTVKKNIEKFKKYLVHNEDNFIHRLEMMKAEYHWLLNDMDLVVKHFSNAIRYARKNKFIHDEAMAWERFGVFYQSQNQSEVAQFYFSNAYKAYSKWGAKAKLEQMKEMYAGFISPDEIGIKSNNLDLDTILKTINLISGEMVLGNILTGLMQLVTENAGAERAFLVTKEKSKKLIKASLDISNNEIKVMQDVPFDQFEEISHSVVNYVMRTGETLVLDDAGTKLPYSNDEYIIRNKIKSVVCLPLKHAGEGFAYLYLENRLLSGAFTQERIEILQVMASQTAISLQNAMLLEQTTQLNMELKQEVEVRRAVEENLRINEKRLEEYNANLENKVNERTIDLQSEKEKTDELLLNILPMDIARELKEKGTAQAKKYESVSVLFTDFVGFSIIAENMSADELVSEIDYCFKEFDRIIQKYPIEKIKTIGDSYMAVGGLPVTNQTHATDVIHAAIEIRDFIEEHKKKKKAQNKPIFEVRIGVHTGNVVAGIVGLKKFAYDIWGDTVNLASRMESSSEAGKINISGITYELVKNQFVCTYRGKIMAKNKGEVDMYFVEGVK